MKNLAVLLLLLTFAVSCKTKVEPLPYLGDKEIVDGKEVLPVIRPFEYLNQDSLKITNESFANKIYVADFFFTSCPSICPKVMKQMLRLYDRFKDNPNIILVSFTLDPKRDTAEKLKLYSSNLGVDSKSWYFLTGDKDSTLDLAKDFYVSAFEDENAPGGFDHSGNIVLVDKKGHVRAFCQGTDPETIPKFIENIEQLLNEK